MSQKAEKTLPQVKTNLSGWWWSSLWRRTRIWYKGRQKNSFRKLNVWLDIKHQPLSFAKLACTSSVYVFRFDLLLCTYSLWKIWPKKSWKKFNLTKWTHFAKEELEQMHFLRNSDKVIYMSTSPLCYFSSLLENNSLYTSLEKYVFSESVFLRITFGPQ